MSALYYWAKGGKDPEDLAAIVGLGGMGLLIIAGVATAKLQPRLQPTGHAQ
jgi:hypothetical protein